MAVRYGSCAGMEGCAAERACLGWGRVILTRPCATIIWAQLHVICWAPAPFTTCLPQKLNHALYEVHWVWAAPKAVLVY